MATTQERNACYGCKNRGSVPGSAHSTCTAKGASIVGLSQARAGTLNDDPVVILPATEGVEVIGMVIGDRHGFEKGWFTWPLDFDPCWLRGCSMYDPQEDV